MLRLKRRYITDLVGHLLKYWLLQELLYAETVLCHNTMLAIRERTSHRYVVTCSVWCMLLWVPCLIKVDTNGRGWTLSGEPVFIGVKLTDAFPSYITHGMLAWSVAGVSRLGTCVKFVCCCSHQSKGVQYTSTWLACILHTPVRDNVPWGWCRQQLPSPNRRNVSVLNVNYGGVRLDSHSM